MKPSSFTAGQIAAAAGSAVALALLAATGLGALARPSDQASRLQRLESAAERVERATKGPGDSAAYSADALCRGSLEDAAIAAEQRVKAVGASAGLTMAEVTATPGLHSPDEPLAEVRVEFEAAGAYDAALHMLNLLARSQPEVFADRLDLGMKGSSVTLNFSGRLLCSTSARL